ISGTLSNTTGIYTVTATASDGTLSSNQTFTWTVLTQAIAFAQVNYATPQTPSTSVAVPFKAAQTAGDLNVVIVGWNDSTSQVQPGTDTKGNFYAPAVGPPAQPALPQSIYHARNITAAAAGANSVTVTFNAAAAFPDVRIAEYRGLDPVSPLDAAVAGQG